MRWDRYGFAHGEGLYTDMNAIRRDEETDNVHSLFVDQWDWERIIDKEERNVDTLKAIVNKVYQALMETEDYMAMQYDYIKKSLPEQITFVTTQELEDRYPDKTPKEREYEAVKEYGAVFLMQIGDKLASGEPHDGRSPDYDDWSLNGDIIVYYPVLDMAFEISSMGIRVDEKALKEQLEKSRMPGARKPSVPERNFGKETSVYHRWWNRTVKNLYVFLKKSTYWRSTSIDLAG